MAAAREKRCNAGNRMSKVLEEELGEDDFYKNTYGGFEEVEEDGDFQSGQEDSADDVDSDFDNSEEDDNNEVFDEDADQPRRKKIIKGYKEPSRKPPPPPKKPKVSEDISVKDKNLSALDQQVRKSSRQATAKNTLLTNIRKKEREEVHKKKRGLPKKATTEVRRLTQEELMAEAEKTEKKNVKSLENYLRLEETRKRTMNSYKRSRLEGVPTIIELSLTMYDHDMKDEQDTLKDNRFSRQFYIFSDYSTMDDKYEECVKTIKEPPSPATCPVSGKPARYCDPVTGIRYHDIAALKEIRAVYEELKTENKVNVKAIKVETSDSL